MPVLTAFIHITFTIRIKQGSVGLGRKSLVSQTFRHVAYLYKLLFVIYHVICQELSSFIIFMNSCLCYISIPFNFYSLCYLMCMMCWPSAE